MAFPVSLSVKWEVRPEASEVLTPKVKDWLCPIQTQDGFFPNSSPFLCVRFLNIFKATNDPLDYPDSKS